ncbi:ankyrin repeat domain-containing protein [Timonella sp. A28]|uniref:ankyrin repeat domain-containing protein n=1 Tax=Timonella sp. A28 TaxID=3442640 RepID=UPI003EB6C1FB
MSESFLLSLPAEERAKFIEGVFDFARAGHTQELAEMLDAGVPVDLTNARNDSLLIVATYAQQAEAVSLLLSRGAPTDHINNMGQTALSCAVFRNDEGVLRQLLSAGADPHAGAHSALAIAQQFGLSAMADILSQE